MAEFARFPAAIQHTVAEYIASDEDVLLCFVAGSPMFSTGDYVVITNARVLILEERRIGPMGSPYVNVQCNLSCPTILSVECERLLRHWLFHQMTLKLAVPGRTYLIRNVSFGDGKKAATLLERLREAPHDRVPAADADVV